MIWMMSCVIWNHLEHELCDLDVELCDLEVFDLEYELCDLVLFVLVLFALHLCDLDFDF